MDLHLVYSLAHFVHFLVYVHAVVLLLVVVQPAVDFLGPPPRGHQLHLVSLSASSRTPPSLFSTVQAFSCAMFLYLLQRLAAALLAFRFQCQLEDRQGLK